MLNQFSMFAAYNGWANERLYVAAAALSDAEFHRDVGAFFHSMKGTLNHLLVADRIWMRRFTGEGDHPDRLDAILHEKPDALVLARKAEDRRIVRYIEELELHDLAGTISYQTITSPQKMKQTLSSALYHFFNHQTHHRGQAHAILSILGKDPPPLDLLFFLRADEGKQYL